MLKTLVFCAAALIAAVPGAAAAGEPAPRSIAVPTADLDLADREGLAELDLRLREAAGTICGRPNTASSVEVSLNRRCRLLVSRAARQEAAVIIARRTTGAALAAR
jgi:UrcA family protein